MSEAVVSLTVEALGNMLIQEASFLSRVKNEVEEMKEELQTLQCYLKDADKRQYEDETIRYCVKSIRKLAYHIEDVLETYAIKVESRKAGMGIKNTLIRCACLLNEAVNLHRLGLEIQNIKSQIQSLTRKLQNYGILKVEDKGKRPNSTAAGAASQNLDRQTFAHDVEEDLIPMENEVGELVSLVIDDRESDQYAGRIISILGMGGSGKTTLAKQVFNHDKIQKHFKAFAWVVVSQNLDPCHLLKDIFRQLKQGKDTSRMEFRELVDELYKAQGETRCLVVFDDIWKKEHWEILRPAFATTTTVLFTTRKEEVARIGLVHKINLFSENEGWQLLKRKAFKRKALTTASARAHEEERHEELGKKIVRECGYLPLAICVIGGILSRKETLREWKMVSNDIDSYLMFGEGIDGDPKLMNILNLSYEDLPYPSKTCFLYLARYPEDAEIDLENLYSMWIAEGIVLPRDQRGDESLMEAAERHLTELASRSLVQVELSESLKASKNSRYKSCHLHDLMREFCKWKCKEEEFLNIAEFRDGKQISILNSPAYRLAIHDDNKKPDDSICSKILQEANKGSRAFSYLHTIAAGDSPIFTHGASKGLRNLRFPRVIEFKRVAFPDPKLLNKAINDLIHLRFLGFMDCELEEVPSSIARLAYLHTFYLHTLSGVWIPDVFWKLKTLKHLHLVVGSNTNSGKRKLRLDGLGGLEMLRTLGLDYIEVNDLLKLSNLRVFDSTVNNNEDLAVIIDCIEAKNWCRVKGVRLSIHSGCDFKSTNGQNLLQKLFMCPALEDLKIEAHIDKLPKYEESVGMLDSSDLVELCLDGCEILEDPMPMLGKLPKLERLILDKESFKGEELICSLNGFPNLRYLRLNGLAYLRKWRINEGAIINLSHVSIWFCPKLENTTLDEIKRLKALRELHIQQMLEKEDNVMVMGEELIKLVYYE